MIHVTVSDMKTKCQCCLAWKPVHEFRSTGPCSISWWCKECEARPNIDPFTQLPVRNTWT